MPSLSDPTVRSRRTFAWGVLLLTLLAALLISPADPGWSSASAQNEGADEGDMAGDPPANDGAADNQGGEDGGATTTKTEERTFLGWMLKALGWFWLTVFLLLSLVMVMLIATNLLQVRRDVLLPTDFVEEFEQKLNGKDFQNAYELARGDDSFVARVLAAGMSRLNRGYPEVVEGMQEAGEDENMALEHRLSYLALIGTVAPMLGLMGTVMGMIESFEKISQSTVAPKPAELAEGISTALFTTLIGLGIAVPAMVFYSILKNRVQRLVLEIGMVSEGLMSRFSGVSGKRPASGA